MATKKNSRRLILAPRALDLDPPDYQPSIQGGIKLAKELATTDIMNHLFQWWWWWGLQRTIIGMIWLLHAKV